MKKRKIPQCFLSIFFVVPLLAGCNPPDTTYTAPTFVKMELKGSSIHVSSANLPLKENSEEIGDDILDDLREHLETENDSEVKYYALTNKEFKISITLANPDNLEIKEINLDGVSYEASTFSSNSTKENIEIPLVSPSAPGIIEYKLEKITYIANNEDKDIELNGTKSVKLGVSYDALPSASITNKVVSATSAEFDIMVNDTQGVIKGASSSLKAFVYDGTEYISEKPLVIGENHVLFERLYDNQSYLIIIAACFDKLDGSGVQYLVLTNERFHTKEIIKLNIISYSTSSVSFSVIIDDPHNYGEIISIEAISSDPEKPNVSCDDMSERTIDNLLSNSDYTLEATYKYSFAANEDGVESTAQIGFSTIANQVPTIEFVGGYNITYTSIEFNGLSIVDVDNVGYQTVVELTGPNNYFQRITDVENERGFYNLLSNTSYSIKAKYTYDLKDGSGPKEAIIGTGIKTHTKATPTIEISEGAKTDNSITFGLSITDPAQTGSLSKIELLHSGEVVGSHDNLEARQFSNLLSNNEYQVRVTYAYDLNEGAGEQTLVVTKTIRTDEKEIPVVGIIDVVETRSAVTFSLDIPESESFIEVTSVKLETSDNQVKDELTTFPPYGFLNLTTGTDYYIVVSFEYNLNDGEGVKTQIVRRHVKTLVPAITINDISITNETFPAVGEEVSIQVTSGADLQELGVTAFYINGVRAAISEFKDTRTALVKIVPDIEGGYWEANVTGFEYLSYEDNVRYIAINSLLSDLTFITSELKVLSLGLVSGEDYLVINELSTIQLELENNSGYNITEVVLSIGAYDTDTMVKVDSETIRFDYTPTALGPKIIKVESITYKLPNNAEVTVGEMGPTLHYDVVENNTPIGISTIEEFQAISSNKVYEITADFNGDNFDYVPIEAAGTVILGNNHKLSGIYISPSDSYSGLFKYFSGTILDFGITEARVDAIGYAGGFIAQVNNITTLRNVYVKSSYISALNNVGGLIGRVQFTSGQVCIERSYVDDIIIDSNSRPGLSYFGGLVGHTFMDSGSMNISNSYTNKVRISGGTNAECGGIIGSILTSSSGSNKVTISNSYTSAFTINGYHFLGGIYGRLQSATTAIVIENCVVIGGTIVASLDKYIPSAGFGTEGVNGTYTIINSYVSALTVLKGTNNTASTPSNPVASREEIDSLEFYRDTLKWSTSIWDLSSLNYLNRLFPKLY